MKRLLLIDGSNMLFRAYYAIPAHLTTSTGQPTNAVRGFVTMLNKLLARKTPDFAAVVFDPPGGSFRKRHSPDYKANRARMPEDLRAQIPLIDRAVEAFKFALLRVTDFEADDVIATLARRGEAEGYQVVIVSSDKDFSQLVSERVSLYDAMRELTYDAELVRKKFGVLPYQFVDYQALCGDKVDNIPGVPGIGAKTAASLLVEWDSLDKLLENLPQVKGKAASLIASNRDAALLSRKLAMLDWQVDLDADWSCLAFQNPDQTALNELFTELEFFSLLAADSDSQTLIDEAKDSLHILSDPQELLDLVSTEDRLALNLMATARGFEFDAVGISLIAQVGSVVWFAPFSGPWLGAWKEFFATFEGELIVHDLKAWYRFFIEHNFCSQARFWDNRTASYLIDPAKGMPHDLEKVVKLRLQQVLPALSDLLGKGKKEQKLEDVSFTQAAAFSASWVQAILGLYQVLKPEVSDLGIEALCQQEIALAKVLAKMEVAGIAVDGEGLKALSVEFKKKLAQLEAQIFALVGHEFNVSSPKQLAEVLFEELKLPVIKKTKTGYSTDAAVLEKLAQDYEICKLLLEYRKFDKLITAFVDGLYEYIDSKTGRLHASFGQTASATGRLITSNPNLQQTPVQTEEGRRIRRLFCAPTGYRLLVADWSQIELRILAHLCRDPALVEAFNLNIDVHARTAGELFGKTPSQVSRQEREVAKTVNFATIYGQGSTALAQNLGITKKEAEAIIEKYFKVYSGVRAWLDHTIDMARVMGKVSTIAGRTRFIPELFSKNFAVLQAGERMAINTPVQGSAADICKQAMLSIDRELGKRAYLKSRMLLQIHDELVFECPEAEIEEMTELVRHNMEYGFSLSVPLVVSIGSGPNWEEAKA